MGRRDALEHVRDISRLAYGFMASKALFAALEVDLFTRLAPGPLSLEEASSATGIAPHRLATLLSALSATGLVVGEDGRWANAPATSRYLVAGAPEAFGDYYRLQVDGLIYPMLQHLTAGLRGDESALAPSLAADGMSDRDRAASFSRAQHAGSLGPAAVLARRVDLSGASHLLDVAGGTGAMSITLCQAHPQLTATIIDFPNVVEVGREYVAAAGLQDRVRFVPGSALGVEWPAADVVLLSYLLSAVAGSDIQPLLRRASAVLSGSGGLLLLHDFMLDDDRLGPELAALWFLQYLAERTDAVSFTAADLRRELDGLGFRQVTEESLIPGVTKLLRARGAAR